jgi:transposase
MQGIISHARYNISSGMVEGFNNKIKTMRRKAYGFNDDEYIFLKIIDISK